jgi:hypothetical protein
MDGHAIDQKGYRLLRSIYLLKVIVVRERESNQVRVGGRRRIRDLIFNCPYQFELCDATHKDTFKFSRGSRVAGLVCRLLELLEGNVQKLEIVRTHRTPPDPV